MPTLHTSRLGITELVDASFPCAGTTPTSFLIYSNSFGPFGSVVSAVVSSGTPPPGVTPFFCQIATQSRAWMKGTPTALGVYTYTVHIVTADPSDVFVDIVHTVALLGPPAGPGGGGCPLIDLSPASPLDDEFETEPISIQFAAANGAAPYTWDVPDDSELPDGLALSSGGLLTGAATTPGSYTFTIRATDANGCPGVTLYALEVLATDAIVLSPTSLPGGDRQVDYLELITAEGGIGAPYVFDLSAGTLPPGLTLDAGGLIHGSPANAGAFAFTVRATDGGSNTGTRAYTLNVAGLRIVIDGEDVTAEVSNAEIELTMNRQATATIEIGDQYIPARGAPVLIYRRDGITPIFGGIILTRAIGGMTESSPANKGTLDCADASIFFDDADPVTIVSTVTQDLEDVIAAIVAQSLAVYGITYTPTATGITVPPIEWTEITVPDAFKRITDATGVLFRVLPLRALVVFRPLDEAAPATITDATINAFDLSWSDPPNLARNTVDLLCGPTGNGVTTQEWEADGYETSWEVDIQAVIGDAWPGARSHAFLGATGNFADGDTVTLGSSTYTMRTALVGDVAGEVLIGADGNESLGNINAAINNAGGGNYAPSTPVNADADSYIRFPDQLAANALVVGVVGDSIALATTGVAGQWYGEGGIAISTMQLGSDPSGVAGWTQGYVRENPGVGQVDRTLGAPGTGGYYSWDVTAGRGTISVDAGVTPPQYTVLELVYLAVFPFHARVPASLPPGTPPITFREAHPEIITYPAGIALATQILARESAAARKLDVFTDVEGFQPGQELDVDTTYRGGLVASFLVATVRVTPVNAELWEYRIDCEESDEYTGSFVEQWKALTSGGSGGSSSAAPATLPAGGAIGAGDIFSDGRTSFRAPQSMGGNKLRFVADPDDPQDAATKASQDAGDASTLAAAEVAAETYADAGDAAALATIAAEHYIKRDGSIAFTGPQSMGTNAITDLEDPTDPQDAATKQYVDDNAGGGGGPTVDGGGLVLLEEHIAAGSASLDFTTRNKGGKTGATFQTDFDEYLIEIVGVQPATNNTGLQLRVTTDGGSTWITAADYTWAHMAYGIGGPGNVSSGGASSINIIGFTNLSNGSSKGANGLLRVFKPLDAGVWKIFGGQAFFFDTTPNVVLGTNVAAYMQTTPIDGVQFFAGSGNLAAGVIRIYGIDKTGSSAGAQVMLESEIVAGAAALVFATRNAPGQSGDAFQSDYEEYDLDLLGLFPSTNGAVSHIEVSTDGGSTWLSSGYRYSARYFGDAADSGSAGNSQAAAFFLLAGTHANALPGLAGTLRITIYAGHTTIGGKVAFNHSNTNRYVFDLGMWIPQTINALRIVMDSGNLTGKGVLIAIPKG